MKTIKLISLVFLLIIMVGCSTDTQSTNNDGNTDNSSQEETIKEEELKTDDERFSLLLRDFNSFISMKSREEGYKSFENNEMGVLAFKLLGDSDFTKTKEKAEEGNYFYTLKGSALEEKIKRYFGNEATFDKKTFVGASPITSANIADGSGGYVYSYDEKSDLYKLAFFGIGGGGPEASVEDKKVVSAVLKGDTIEVVQKVIYTSYEMGDSTLNYTIYSDPDRKNAIGTKKLDYENAYKETISVNDYLEKASTITVVLKKHENSDDYYFYKSSLSISG